MAIKEFLPVHRFLYGDGESTEVVLDFTDEIKASKICCGDPDEVRNASLDQPDLSVNLDGSKVNVKFGSPPGKDAVVSVSLNLLFHCKTEKKHKAAEHKEEHAHHKHHK